MLTTFSGRNPSQDEFELTWFINLLQERGVHRYLEIGARHGDTFHKIMTSVPVDGYGVAVDLPGGLWGAHSSRNALKAACADLNRRGYDASMIFGDSHTDATRKLIKGRGPFDAILIDGDHTLSGVTADWLSYQRCAPLIAFHDIVGTGQIEKVGGRPVEVPLLWEFLRRQYRHTEFIGPDSRMGIGCLFL